MIKHFYSYIVETDTLFMEIDSLSITESEKDHLKALAESHIHHNVLDTILSELSDEDKKTFLNHMESKNQENVWSFLHDHIEDSEEKIKRAAHEIKKELHKDLKEAKSENN